MIQGGDRSATIVVPEKVAWTPHQPSFVGRSTMGTSHEPDHTLMKPTEMQSASFAVYKETDISKSGLLNYLQKVGSIPLLSRAQLVENASNRPNTTYHPKRTLVTNMTPFSQAKM